MVIRSGVPAQVPSDLANSSVFGVADLNFDNDTLPTGIFGQDVNPAYVSYHLPPDQLEPRLQRVEVVNEVVFNIALQTD